MPARGSPVDNCFCTPALQRPVEYGADLVIHSGTKYLDGQGRVIAGAICASDEIVDERLMPVLRSAGMALSPFNAWVVLKGLETLSIRMQAQSARALQLAAWLETQDEVERVFYPGLASHPQHALAMAQQRGCGGAVVSFIVKGATAAARRGAQQRVPRDRQHAGLLDHREPRRHQDDDHAPGSTSHGRLTEEQRQAAGITQGMIRVAVGLDDVEDIKADLLRGLGRSL
jgi:O-succinylhomoserine sulfhydrylase